MRFLKECVVLAIKVFMGEVVIAMTIFLAMGAYWIGIAAIALIIAAIGGE